MVKFDQQIPPGEEGHIELSVKIYPNWAGKSFKKMAVVRTNDPKLGKFFLTLKGLVEAKPGQKASQ
ncbi:MAG: hypothetical protein AB1896_21340 [Thermodesulfobacteriota bacterium]